MPSFYCNDCPMDGPCYCEMEVQRMMTPSNYPSPQTPQKSEWEIEEEMLAKYPSLRNEILRARELRLCEEGRT